MSRRTEKVASAIRQEVAEIVQRELSDPRLEGAFPSINRVRVSEDLSVVDIYVIVMGGPAKEQLALAALRAAAGMMRGRVGRTLRMRSAPYINFHIDEAYRREMEIHDLLRKAEAERIDLDEEGRPINRVEDEISQDETPGDVEVAESDEEKKDEPA